MNLATTLIGNDFWSKALLALIGGAIGFASAIVLDQIKARREPRKELTWEAEEERSMVAVQPSVREKVQILYKGVKVADLLSIKCRISNTGNKVVKGQRIRFEFPDDSSVLEAGPDPEPPREFGVVEHPETDGVERIYSIAHLERGQAVTFQIVLGGMKSDDWKLHLFNEEGDVAFLRRDTARSKADQEHVFPFLLFSILILLVPPVLDGVLMGGIGTLASTGLYIVFAILLIPHIAPFLRVVQRIISAIIEPRTNDAAVHVYGDKPDLIVTKNVSGTVEFKRVTDTHEEDAMPPMRDAGPTD